MVELNRRLVKGYTFYKDDPRIQHLKKSVNDYNRQLHLLNLRDHQVEYARFSIINVVLTLVYRLGKLAVLAIGTLPGLGLFAPVFVAAKLISIKKSREALAASTVKIQGRDVMATWKLLVALAFAPLLYTFYGICFAVLAYKNRIWGRVPEWVPLWAFIVAEIIIFPSITFAALRFGEVGMDIFKSLRPLVLSLNPTSANTLHRLREKRRTLSAEVTEVINTLGPEMFPDFDSARIIADPFREGYSSVSLSSFPRTEQADTSPTAPAGIGGGSSASGHVPRNDSLSDIQTIGIFASQPHTPTSEHSRSRSQSRSRNGSGGTMQGLSMLNSKEDVEEVSLKIRKAMMGRGKERTSRRSGVVTPGSEDLEMSRKDV